MPGSPLNLDLPTLSDLWPTWSEKALDAFEAIEADLEAPVMFSEMSADDDLDANNFGIESLSHLTFYAGNSADIPVNGIGFKDGDLWVTDGAGNQIQLITGGAINIANAGGIGGDYVSSGALVSFDNGSDTYQFYDNTGTAFADVQAAAFVLEGVSNGQLSLTWAGDTDYSIVFPDQAPAGPALLSIDSAGVMSTTAPITQGVEFSNTNITLSGTARIKHPNTTFWVAPDFLNRSGGSAVTGGAVVVASGVTAVFSLPAVEVGKRLKAVSIRVNKGTAALSTVSVTSYTDGISTTVATDTTSTSGTQTVTATLGAPVAAPAHTTYGVQISFPVGASNTIYAIGIVVDEA
jgi:hypothetical protein